MLHRIACVSCPTLYTKLISMKPQSCQTVLLEYDRRFEIYGENFIYYDYNHLPGERLREHSFDLVVADPPYLSEECLRKTSQTVKHLAKDKILLCTGRATLLVNTNFNTVTIDTKYYCTRITKYL